MTLPLIVLALLTVVAGVAVGIPSEQGTPLRALPGAGVPAARSARTEASRRSLLLVLAVLVFAAGFALAWSMYWPTRSAPAEIGQPKTPVHALLLNAYYVDALYDRLIVRPLFALSVLPGARVRPGA